MKSHRVHQSDYYTSVNCVAAGNVCIILPITFRFEITNEIRESRKKKLECHPHCGSRGKVRGIKKVLGLHVLGNKNIYTKSVSVNCPFFFPGVLSLCCSLNIRTKSKQKLFRQYSQSFNKRSNAIHRCNNQDLLKAAACNYCI